MKYWKIVADKAQRCGLIMRLLQRCHRRWLAVDRRLPIALRRYLVQSDELLSAFLELEARRRLQLIPFLDC
jgi:hypothetical protein